MSDRAAALVVERIIRAPATRVFDAWTDAAQLRAWWGPEGVRCEDAVIDLRVGGRFHIDNRLPDGRLVRIAGEFLVVEAPRRLVYTWSTGPGIDERVTVSFEATGDDTRVVVTHERVDDPERRAGHADGWRGCLAGLDALLAREGGPAGVP